MSPARRGPNPKSGTVGPKRATMGVPTAVARCSGAESFVTSTAARWMSAAEARRRELARRAHRPARRGRDDRISQRPILRATNDHARPVEPGGQHGVVRPTLRAPDRAGGERDEPGAHSMCRQPVVRRGVIGGGEPQTDARCRCRSTPRVSGAARLHAPRSSAAPAGCK